MHDVLKPFKYYSHIKFQVNISYGSRVLESIQRPATGGAGGAVFTGLRVPEQILKLFECQLILLKILRLCVKNNPVKLIPY
jgi:hypothetical protein